MLLQLDFKSETPIYTQIRNQIVMGIASGALAQNEKLPAIRALASDIGVNMMTVNKAYQLLKQEGYIEADRRSGAVVLTSPEGTGGAPSLDPKSQNALKLIISEAKLAGYTSESFSKLCSDYFNDMERE